MTSRSIPKLSALRDIGWTYWDPIGLRGMISDDFREGPVDEYDSYLKAAYGKLCDGNSELEVSAYLDDIARNHMGLGSTKDGEDSARKTVRKRTELMKALT